MVLPDHNIFFPIVSPYMSSSDLPVAFVFWFVFWIKYFLIDSGSSATTGVLCRYPRTCFKTDNSSALFSFPEASVAAFSYTAPQVVVGGATVFVTNVEQFEKY